MGSGAERCEKFAPPAARWKSEPRVGCMADCARAPPPACWRRNRTRMNKPTHSVAKRLEILRLSDAHRPWDSLDDKRQCVLCEQKFSGHQVRFTIGRHGELRPHCPTEDCVSTPLEWVAAGNPLLDDETWRDWTHILSESADDAPAQTPFRSENNNNLAD